MAKRTPPRLHLFNVTLQGMEELDHFKSAADRQRALDEVAREVRGRDLAIGIALCAGAGAASLALVRFTFQYLLPASIPARVANLACYAGLALGIFLMLRFLHRWGAARALRQKLVATGVPVCVGCGYNLAGLPALTRDCPECGRAIEPKVTALLESDTTKGAGTPPEAAA